MAEFPLDSEEVSNQDLLQMMGELKGELRDNTDKTTDMHRILVGQPEYKRKGLVEIVDKHDNLIVRGGAVFCTLFFIWEIIKVIHPFY